MPSDPLEQPGSDALGAAADPACAVAHGDRQPDRVAGTLVVVYATPLADVLLRWGRELGFTTLLVEPDANRVGDQHRAAADAVAKRTADVQSGDDVDVVVTDHHRDDLVDQLEQVVQRPARSIGLMGSPRHAPPHVEPLRARGVPEALIGRVQRPIGLDIGSKAPAEIALATLAGLVAQRNERPGGFFPRHADVM